MSDATPERLQDVCRSLPGVTEDIKWESNLVFSVHGKMFAVFDTDGGESFSFKVDPEAFDVLTARPGVVPAPYLAKHYWVKVDTAGTLPLDFLEDLFEESHRLVAAKLSKKAQRELGLID